MILDLGMSLEYIDCYCIIAGLILPPNSITALLVGIGFHIFPRSRPTSPIEPEDYCTHLTIEPLRLMLSLLYNILHKVVQMVFFHLVPEGHSFF